MLYEKGINNTILNFQVGICILSCLPAKCLKLWYHTVLFFKVSRLTGFPAFLTYIVEQLPAIKAGIYPKAPH